LVRKRSAVLRLEEVMFRRRSLIGLVVAALVVLSGPAWADPGGHRARLSQDLERHLSAGDMATVDVIVSGSQDEITALAARYGVTPKRWLDKGAVLQVSADALKSLSQDEAVAHLSGDVTVRSSMAITGEAIGADQVWAGLDGLKKFTGRGITVALIDSGVANVRAIRNQVLVSVDFTQAGGAGLDEYGHGTHVAGIIAAQPSRGNQADYAGVAPGASIVNLKVLDADGSGSVSNVIAAIDWAIAHRKQYGIRIVNLSLGHPVFESADDDPLCQAVQRAVAHGLVVVAAAGNVGKTDDGRMVLGGIDSPGNSP
jgi:serine protease AprX